MANNNKYIFAYVSKDLHQRVKEFCVKKKISIVKLMTKLLEKEMSKGSNGTSKLG